MKDDDALRISQWLQSRQTLLVNLFDIQQLSPKAIRSKSSQSIISNFCDRLIDYISAGHFEIYHKMLAIIDSSSNWQLTKAHSVLNTIQNSTDIAVAFNDHYDKCIQNQLDAVFLQRLSELAESLAERFELEDLLFSQYSSQLSSLSA